MTATDARRGGKSRQGAAATQIVYDVVVLGSQLSGVLAGALLAKRGYRVLHVYPDGLGAGYEHHGYHLPYAPSLLPHLRRLPAAESALGELGVGVDLFRALDAAPLTLQLLFPRNRLDLAPERRAAEVAREFAGRQERIVSGLSASQGRAEATDPFFKLSLPFPPDGFFERRAVKKAAAGCPALAEDAGEPAAFEGTPLPGAVHALGRYLTYLEDAEAGPLAHQRPVAQLLGGAHRYPGGYDGLREALRSRLVDLGGETVGDAAAPADVEELLFDGGRFSGVKLAGTSHVYRGHCLLVAMDLAGLAALIPPKAKKHGLAGLLGSVRVRRSLFSTNLVVKEAGLPLGLGELAVVHPGDEFLGPVLLEVLPARKAGKDVPGERVLAAAAFVPYGEHSNADERQRDLARRLEAVTTEVAPFLERHVVARSIPAADARNLKGTRLLYHPLIEVDADRVLGVAGLPHRTPCKNLFLASREALPGLGLEGELLSAHRAGALVGELLKKHNPLK